MPLLVFAPYSSQYSPQTDMDKAADREERKREYNKLAQREFRRRRKEHLKNLERAQKDQDSEQSEEIERLRYQNDELKRENEALRAQVYGPSSSRSQSGMSAPINVANLSSDGRSYSLSPSISGTSISGTSSPPGTMSSEMVPLTALSFTSAMMAPATQAYNDLSALSSQPYSMVHSSGIRHGSPSSPESSEFRSSQSAMGASFHSLNINQPGNVDRLPGQSQTRTSSLQDLTALVPYNINQARNDILEIFRFLITDPTIIASPAKHLAVLRSMSDSLPDVLKPSKAQLENPHYYGIDLIASPSLRERLMNVTGDVAASFTAEVGIWGIEHGDVEQIIIWGDDPFSEMSWEFSQPILDRWGWLLGREWVDRANFWRRQRGVPPLPNW